MQFSLRSVYVYNLENSTTVMELFIDRMMLLYCIDIIVIIQKISSTNTQNHTTHTYTYSLTSLINALYSHTLQMYLSTANDNVTA